MQSSVKGNPNKIKAKLNEIEFLRENKRYKPMLEADTLDDQITALGKSGYATDPEYAKKIADIAKSKRLEVLVSA